MTYTLPRHESLRARAMFQVAQLTDEELADALEPVEEPEEPYSHDQMLVEAR